MTARRFPYGVRAWACRREHQLPAQPLPRRRARRRGGRARIAHHHARRLHTRTARRGAGAAVRGLLAGRRVLRHYTLAEISDRITCDVLLLAGAEDHHIPLAQLYRQAEALTSARSVTTLVFTRAEEAASHCQMGNLDLACATIAAWTHERIASAA